MNDFALVRRLCAEITAETDPERAQDLICLLRAIVKDNTQDGWTGLAILHDKYRCEPSAAN
jgi:hypothetical protein